MLTTKRVEVDGPVGNACARSGHNVTSDFSTFDDFEQELLEAIASVEDGQGSDAPDEPCS